jgi:Septum formation
VFRWSVRSRRLPVVAAVVAALLLSGCSWFGSKSKSLAVSVSVFSIQPGQCFNAPAEVKDQLSSVSRVPCSAPHTEEAYATITYAPPGTQSPSAAASSASGGPYPGAQALTAFANGACAAQFGKYVGKSYLDSSLFFTYLLPSARSWQEDNDETVICFVTQAGGTRTGSAKNSKL